MKFILILTLSIAMIGVMVPDALGKTYVGEVVPYKSGEPYGFSIDYPNDWVIYDEVIDENLDLRIWEKNFLTTMRIIYIDDHTMPPLSDNEHIDLMNKLAKDNCNNDIFGNDVICYDFAHLSEEDNSIVYEIDGEEKRRHFISRFQPVLEEDSTAIEEVVEKSAIEIHAEKKHIELEKKKIDAEVERIVKDRKIDDEAKDIKNVASCVKAKVIEHREQLKREDPKKTRKQLDEECKLFEKELQVRLDIMESE